MSDLKADLHLHTFHSDGTYAPEALGKMAEASGLSALAVTDHDTVAGVEAAQAGANGSVEILSGAELTASFEDRELHILGFGIRTDDPDLQDFLSKKQDRRRNRIQKMIQKLQEHGVCVSFEEVEAVAGVGTIGRPHLAQVLLNKGIIKTFSEAFDRYLGDQAPCFSLSQVPPVARVVQIIQNAGGVAVLAHPHRMVQDSWIPKLVEDGIEGIEINHPDHHKDARKKYQKIAQEHRLLPSGGSDCHGTRKTGGPTFGKVTIPYRWMEQIKERIQSRVLSI